MLFLSSPIGLGHARRDLAIADELRKRRPDVEIEWLAQHPVTAVLEAAGERVHPASRWLASESAHVEGECGEHDLHVFQAVRAMDEILLANFHVLDDLTADEHFDLVVGDEAWDLDHFLHENPELKRTAYAWLTDFVGNLPMPEGGPEEVRLTTDHNAQMIEQVERYPRLRDARAVRRRPRRRRPRRVRPRAAVDPRLDLRALHLPGLRHRLHARGPAGPARDPRRAGLAPGRAGLPGHRRRDRGGTATAAPRRRRAARGAATGAGAADGRGHRAADRPGGGAGGAGARGARLGARPLPAPGRLRPRRSPTAGSRPRWS